MLYVGVGRLFRAKQLDQPVTKLLVLLTNSRFGSRPSCWRRWGAFGAKMRVTSGSYVILRDQLLEASNGRQPAARPALG